jgi:predicted outer membrane repeat protein
VFLNNSAAGNGGAIASESDGFSALSTPVSTRLIVEGSSFVGNAAARSGGAIFLDASSASITRNAFSGNSATFGRAIFATGSFVNSFATATGDAMGALIQRNGFASDQDVMLA